jgi:hypothetical protein
MNHYGRAGLGILQQVAKRVAVAVENALAPSRLPARDKLAKEKLYLERSDRVQFRGNRR